MLCLPVDVLKIVLEYVRLKRDLKSLCLTSKALHDLSVPYLYESVDLYMWDHEQGDATRFARSVAAGAGRYLRFTRHAMFACGPPAPEPPSPDIIDHSLDIALTKYPMHTSSAEVFVEITLLLEMFPHNTLKALDIESAAALPARLILYLEQHQQNLEQLAATLGKCQYLSAETWSRFIPDSLHTLQLSLVSDVEHFEAFLPGLLHIGQRLERLSLDLATEDCSVEVLKQLSALQSKQSLDRLEELSLIRFNLKDLFNPLSKIIDFTRLTAITWSLCSGSDGFLGDMKESISQNTSLQHFDADVDGKEQFFDIIRSCSNLKSLHLSSGSPWHIDRSPRAMQWFQTNGGLVHTLTFHSTVLEGGDYSIDRAFCDVICRYCSRLKQLGFELSDLGVNFDLWEDGHGFRDYLSCFPSLPELRIVRLWYFTTGVTLKPRELSWYAQRFATTIFQYLEEKQSCPMFQAVVFSVGWTDDDSSSLQTVRHCFVKGSQTDNLHRQVPVAIQVPTYMLRDLDPSLYICSYIPQDSGVWIHEGLE
ncbi:hypothetical protein K491DRAFT_324517 [Lophiostoma macrostomum CBS 122681]|uniref:F-box domain-containing protein n=1 Tax=Lophiostoma macrostomum CBS 122681 TaxID=1314788 RepID=A0A6A6TE10_9PLEO|nr:hypothetical protein K491DRAFT_324517 [Lophiostoma macrostomum CBS 122681]